MEPVRHDKPRLRAARRLSRLALCDYFFFLGFLTGLGDPTSYSMDPPLLPVFPLLCFGFFVVVFLFGIAVGSGT